MTKILVIYYKCSQLEDLNLSSFNNNDELGVKDIFYNWIALNSPETDNKKNKWRIQKF